MTVTRRRMLTRCDRRGYTTARSGRLDSHPQRFAQIPNHGMSHAGGGPHTQARPAET